VPEKPERALIVIVDDPLHPALTVTDVGLAEMLKSWILKFRVTEWVRVPFGPAAAVIVTV